MPGFITVTATYDWNLIFYPNGYTVSIAADTPILGKRLLPTQVAIAGAVGYVPEAEMLHIKSADHGDLFLNMTLAAYDALVATASLNAPITKNLTLTVPADTATGVTVTNAALYNAVLESVSKNGIALDIRTMTIANSGANGVLTLAAGDSLSSGDTIIIIYYTK